ncbi:MAG: SDR family NAD(P)-dependent oxidoreductase [Gammaproteobacteria bacterium]|nr:SDR family NAD(P)-dependent oxidoreductase [Gammaproteobacteria bacterium]
MPKIALVTGASQGIGLELAERLSADGYSLVLVGRDPHTLELAAAQLELDQPSRAIIFSTDLSQPGATERLVDQLGERGLDIEVLVNNAAYGASGPFTELDLDTQLGMIRLNIASLTELTYRLAGPMLQRGHGKILNVASTAAFEPGPGMAIYYATKAYVLSFSEAIAEELHDSGVTVTTLCPGPTETGFQRRAGIEASRLIQIGMMSAHDVATAGYEGMLAGKRIVIPGALNKATVQANRIFPRRLMTRMVGRVLRNR